MQKHNAREMTEKIAMLAELPEAPEVVCWTGPVAAELLDEVDEVELEELVLLLLLPLYAPAVGRDFLVEVCKLLDFADELAADPVADAEVEAEELAEPVAVDAVPVTVLETAASVCITAATLWLEVAAAAPFEETAEV